MDSNTERNVRIDRRVTFKRSKLVPSGQINRRFKFEIHFRNHTEELGSLLWVLDKANKDGQYRLKLGMGKSYGLGSVAIKAEPQLTERAERYGKLFANATKWNIGVMSPITTDKKLKDAGDKFAKKILSNNAINPEGKQTIDDLARVQELLALLHYPGPDEGHARYMKLNEFAGREESVFSQRAVLPTPRVVLTNRLPSTSPEPPQDDKPSETLSSFRQPSRRPNVLEPLPEPPKSEVEISQFAKESPEKIAQQSTEREENEKWKKQQKAEKKNKGKHKKK